MALRGPNRQGQPLGDLAIRQALRHKQCDLAFPLRETPCGPDAIIVRSLLREGESDAMRPLAKLTEIPGRLRASPEWDHSLKLQPVSYTHLTLPTIYSV